jgi:hypothetical protein
MPYTALHPPDVSKTWSFPALTEDLRSHCTCNGTRPCLLPSFIYSGTSIFLSLTSDPRRDILHCELPPTSTMIHLSFLLSVLTTITGVIAQSNVRFGNAFSLGATNSYIIEAETTLYPSRTQNGDTPRLALWPGMGTDQGQLIQAIVLGSTDAQGQMCGGKPHVNGQWCVFASALQSGTQLQGATFPINSNQGVRIHCMYNPSSSCCNR